MKIFDTRTDILKILKKDAIIAEIGVFKGEFSEKILEICHPNKLYLIDPFDGFTGSGDKDGNNMEVVNLDYHYQNILLPKYETSENVILIKNISDVLSKFQDDFFDYVYIDANHSYEYVKNDLELSYKKVKIGGAILGHDYTNNGFEGVVRAVDEFCKKYDLEISYLTKDGCPTYYIELNNKNEIIC